MIEVDEKFEMEYLDTYMKEIIPKYIQNPILNQHTERLVQLLFKIIQDERQSSNMEINFQKEPTVKKQISETTVPVEYLQKLSPKSEYLADEPILIDFEDSTAPLKPKLITQAEKYLFYTASENPGFKG